MIKVESPKFFLPSLSIDDLLKTRPPRPALVAVEIVPPAPQPQDLSPLVPLITKVLGVFRQLENERKAFFGGRREGKRREGESEASNPKDRLLAKEIFCQTQIVSQRLRPLIPFFLRLALHQKKHLAHRVWAIGSAMTQAFIEENPSVTAKLVRIHERLAKQLYQPTSQKRIHSHPREGTILGRVIERELATAGIKTPQEISFKETPQSRLFLVARHEHTQETGEKGLPPLLRFYLAQFLCRDRLNQGVRAQMVCLGEVPYGEKQIQPRTQPASVREAFIPDHSRVIFPLFTR